MHASRIQVYVAFPTQRDQQNTNTYGILTINHKTIETNHHLEPKEETSPLRIEQ